MSNPYQALPSVEKLLSHPLIKEKRVPARIVVESCRSAVEILRKEMSNESTLEKEELYEKAANLANELIEGAIKSSLRPVINATGIVLNTNLGRAVLSEKAVDAINNVARGYCNIEYDLEKGTRGSRYDHIDYLINKFLNVEGSLVVNNNAAAVYLAIAALADGKEVIISRGQLVEIGGSFRIPEIMAQSKAVLREIGTTNRTKLSDYEKAINENTGMILHVHQSNFYMKGFVEEVGIEELVELGKKHGIPVMSDLGSGCIYPFKDDGIGKELTVEKTIEKGVNVVTFSGDKLLGGPQAGIIVGDKDLIDKMKKHPLLRAFRVDKIIIAALEATFMQYYDMEDAKENIPTVQMLTTPLEVLQEKANDLCSKISKIDSITAEISTANTMAGGGCFPEVEFPAVFVKVKSSKVSPDDLTTTLRLGEPPVISFIRDEATVFDVRTLSEKEIDLVVCAVANVLNKAN